jgi:hypothetical protein
LKLVRPYCPLKVRLEVIARQVIAAHKLRDVLWVEAVIPRDSARLKHLIETMFGDQPVHLDHDPPLCLREIIDAEAGRYEPDANDPRYLVYRTEDEHKIKTFVRGDGAQFSDAAKRRRKIRAERQERPRPNRWPPRGSRLLQWWKTR